MASTMEIVGSQKAEFDVVFPLYFPGTNNGTKATVAIGEQQIHHVFFDQYPSSAWFNIEIGSRFITGTSILYLLQVSHNEWKLKVSDD